MSDFEETLNKILSSPEDMEKIAEIAKSFSASAKEGDAQGESSLLGGLQSLDPKLLGLLGKLMSEYSGKSDKAALLSAISPYLKDEQRGKLARATEMAKLARIGRAALKEFGGGGFFGV